MDLEGKVALVTGGGVRVGRAISLGLARAGARVVVHYNKSSGPAEETVAEARRLGSEAVAVQGDFSSAQQVREVARIARQAFGGPLETPGVDVLVHAASPFVKGRLFDTDLETWHLLSATVVESFFLLTRELAPAMKQRGAGAIVAILDRGAFDPWPEYLFHGLAKMALWGLVRSFAAELAPEIRVNGIVPGPVLPPPGMDAGTAARVAQDTLLKRWGSPQDVVEAVLYLVRADYVTGTAAFVDGGERWVRGA
ncbi:MAG: SDR family oxidoreductase [Anaerolineae bacterium]|jgi:NAD(P)-dependent dehydrogenase (short-subunit alcohol dehydrogenase family)